jgi:hypothetical protein
MKADFSLLRTVSDETYATEPLPAPYVAEFRRGPMRLTFVSTHHETGPETVSAKTVAKAFTASEPRVVVVEGVDARPAAAKEFREHVLRQAENGCARCEESEYAAALAYRAGVPVLGGEPTDRQILDELLRRNYTVKDFLGFYVARQIPVWRRLGRVKETGIEPLTNGFLDYMRRNADMRIRFKYADFLRWFRAHETEGKSPLDLTVEDTAPYDGPETSYFQRICFAMDRKREKVIVRRIESALERRGRVMVVYGSGHLVKQRRVWENLLGRSKNSKPF